MSMSESIVLDIRDLKSHFFTAKGEIPAVDGVSIDEIVYVEDDEDASDVVVLVPDDDDAHAEYIFISR